MLISVMTKLTYLATLAFGMTGLTIMTNHKRRFKNKIINISSSSNNNEAIVNSVNRKLIMHLISFLKTSKFLNRAKKIGQTLLHRRILRRLVKSERVMSLGMRTHVVKLQSLKLFRRLHTLNRHHRRIRSTRLAATSLLFNL